MYIYTHACAQTQTWVHVHTCTCTHKHIFKVFTQFKLVWNRQLHPWTWSLSTHVVMLQGLVRTAWEREWTVNKLVFKQDNLGLHVSGRQAKHGRGKLIQSPNTWVKAGVFELAAGSLALPVPKCCLIKTANVSSGPLHGTNHVKLHAILLSISLGVFFPPHSIPLTASRSAGSEQRIEKQQLGTGVGLYICVHVDTCTHLHLRFAVQMGRDRWLIN